MAVDEAFIHYACLIHNCIGCYINQISKVELDPNQIITKGRDDVQDEVVIVTNFQN
jgi:hypothetical protein